MTHRPPAPRKTDHNAFLAAMDQSRHDPDDKGGLPIWVFWAFVGLAALCPPVFGPVALVCFMARRS